MQSFGLKFIGLALLILFAFLATGLLSFSPDDAVNSMVWPVSSEVRNLCGPIGARTVSVLMDVFGYATFFLLIPIGVEAYRLLRGTPLDQIALRTFGLGLVVFGLTGLCGLFAERIAPMSYHSLPCTPAGPGGLLGASLASLLSRFIAWGGSCTLLTSFLLGGLILLGDRTILALFRCGTALFGLFSFHGPLAEDEHDSDRLQPVSDIDGGTDLKAGIDDWIDNSGGEPELEPIDAEQPSPGLMGWLRPKHRPNRMQRQTARTLQSGADPEAEPHAVVEQRIEEEYRLPSVELLTAPEPFDEALYVDTIRQQAERLEAAFADFNLEVHVVDIQTGPVISQFELRLAKGLRLNKIQSLSDDLAIALKVPSVRIVAPIPGKNTVGVEIPNEHRQMVRLRDVMEQLPESLSKFQIPIYLGKDVSGRPMVVDMTKMPHLLIAGRTGTGKSVCLNSIIVSMLMTRSPEQVRLLMIDPKMVEMSAYESIPHLMHPVVTDMRKAEAILGWAVEKMEERYQLLASARVRQISEYNKLSEEDLRRRMRMLGSSEEEWNLVPKNLPYMVIIADEMADLMMTAAKEVETHIIRLAQKSRAVGIHLILATQKPTVDIVTGLIKSNLPARIAFGVATRTDSQVVLDRTGAERLLGNGDMLFLQPSTGQAIRGQGTYVSDDEIEAIIDVIGTEDQNFVEELILINPDTDGDSATPGSVENGEKGEEKDSRDELYYEAVEYIIQEGRGSLSLLQRRFSIGYGRAARLIDFMAEDGVVGPYNGSQAREVLLTLADWRRRRRRKSESVGPAGSIGVPPSRQTVSVRKDVPIKPDAVSVDDDDYYEEYDEFEYEEDYVAP